MALSLESDALKALGEEASQARMLSIVVEQPDIFGLQGVPDPEVPGAIAAGASYFVLNSLIKSMGFVSWIGYLSKPFGAAAVKDQLNLISIVFEFLRRGQGIDQAAQALMGLSVCEDDDGELCHTRTPSFTLMK